MTLIGMMSSVDLWSSESMIGSTQRARWPSGTMPVSPRATMTVMVMAPAGASTASRPLVASSASVPLAPFDGGAVERAAGQVDRHFVVVEQRERPDPVVAAGFDDWFGFDDGLHGVSLHSSCPG